jgi:hypothetical protein
MATKENNHGGHSVDFADSNELFESIYRAQLDTLRKEKAEKTEDRHSLNPRPTGNGRPHNFDNSKEPETAEETEQPKLWTERAAPEKKSRRSSKRGKLWLLLGLMVILVTVYVNYRTANDLSFVTSIWRPEKKPIVQLTVPMKQQLETGKKEMRKAPFANENLATNHAEPSPTSSAKEEQDVVVPKLAGNEICIDKGSFTGEGHFPPEEVRAADDPWEPLADQKSISYPYSIYLGSYKTPDRAQRAISIYERKGLSPYWVKVDLGEKGVWFRVFAGYFDRREEAELHVRRKGLSEAESKHTKYANLIGVYKSEEELRKIRQALVAFGYCPYVIEGTDGTVCLYTGAFYQKGRAEKEQKHLRSAGIQSQVVER